MNVYDIEKIVRAGGSSLAESLYELRPVLSNAGHISETTSTLYLGHELIKAGFGVCAGREFKIKVEPDPDSLDLLALNENREPDPDSLDLLALNDKKETQIRIKAKMGSNNTTIDDIYQVLKAIKSFQLDPDDDYDYDHYFNNEFGIIICTSWDSTFIKWWENLKAKSIKKSKASTKNEKKVDLLIARSMNRSNEGTGDCASGTCTLEQAEDDNAHPIVHEMQYLIFDLKSKGIKKLLP